MNIKNILPLLPLAILLACNTPHTAQTTPVAPPAVQTPAAPVAPSAFVTWDKKMVELGKVKKGETRTLFFEMTNTSGQEIKIDLVDACECTRVDYPRGTIAPGGKARLDVRFDSSSKDAAETIGINVVFRESDAAGNPRIEVVEYKFDIEK